MNRQSQTQTPAILTENKKGSERKGWCEVRATDVVHANLCRLMCGQFRVASHDKPDYIRLVEISEANVSEATVKLEAVERGDPGAAQELFVLLYAELRRNAAVMLARELPGQTLQPTALVHEAWIRLVGDQNPGFSSRAHFFHAASEAMRRILIDRARSKRTERHGGRYRRVDLDGFDPAAPNADEHLLAVHEVLDKLTSEHPVEAQVVKLKYFAGMTNEEVAEVMGISVSTVKNYWTFSRAWLLNEIESP